LEFTLKRQCLWEQPLSDRSTDLLEVLHHHADLLLGATGQLDRHLVASSDERDGSLVEVPRHAGRSFRRCS
jgi:hypothetical protein